MSAQEIDRDEWLPFFDAFSSLHRGWPVTLEVVSADTPAVMAYEVPLEEISANDGDVSILLRGAPKEDVSHVVERAERVLLREEAGNDDGALEIASGAGATVRLSYKRIALPEPSDELL